MRKFANKAILMCSENPPTNTKRKKWKFRKEREIRNSEFKIINFTSYKKIRFVSLYLDLMLHFKAPHHVHTRQSRNPQDFVAAILPSYFGN